MRFFIMLFSAIAILLGLSACGSDDGTLPAPESIATPSVQAVPQKAVEPKLTTAQANATRKAKMYLDYIGFSRDGLIHQLVDFDHFKEADVVYAIDQLKYDYKKQAVKKAKSYLEFTGYSRDGLIDQLVNFDKFTEAQANYAADQVGL